MLPELKLDEQAREPLYRQLYAQLKKLISAGTLVRGEKIPPTRELAGQLGLNRATVAAAYELLEQEGLIRGHVGRGSFVAGAAGGWLDWEARLKEEWGGERPRWSGEARISFASARPGLDLFPVDEFRACCAEVVGAADAGRILQLGSPYGYAPLREWLLEQGRREGTVRAGDDLLVTSGCQQALDLLQRLLLRPGETALIEDPVYPGLRDVFLRAGLRVVGAPVGLGGLDADGLCRLIEAEKPRAVVVTPNFQNPTGATLPAEARRALLDHARKAGVVVVENDIYGALRYEGEDVPPLKQLDPGGDVIQLRSFSKLAFPGLRVGWVTAPRAVVRRLAEWKQLADLHTDQLSQAVLLRFAESGCLERHRRQMLAAGRARLRAVLASCARSMPEGTRMTRPEGGMNLWVSLPAPLDAERLLAKAEEAGVSYLPGRVFAVSRSEPGALRLSFAGLPPGLIEEGVAVLGEVFGQQLRAGEAPQDAGLAPAIV